MNFRLFAYASFLSPSILLAAAEGGGGTNPPAPVPNPVQQPTASPSSNEESKKVINNVGKEPVLPDGSGQPNQSNDLIQYETKPPIDNSKACS